MTLTVEEITLRITEAETAYHELAMGKGVVQVKDENGEEVVYNRANMRTLDNYIKRLKTSLIDTSASRLPVTGPLRFTF